MDSRLKLLNGYLTGYDRKLFAKRVDRPKGVIGIYRDSRPTPHFVFALTKDWSFRTKPIEWGIDPIMNRLRAHDLWHRHNFMNQVFEENEKVDESRTRSLNNSVESFLAEFRKQFARATNEINTSNLGKTDRRRMKDGN